MHQVFLVVPKMEYNPWLVESVTGKSLSEALILGSTNPQNDKRLYIDLPVQYIHENYKLRTCCVHKLFFVLTFRTIYAHNMFSPCSELVVFMY